MAYDPAFLATLLQAQNQPDISEQPYPVRGIGGGRADLVPAEITPSEPGEAPQPAALSEGEFVIPAWAIAALGGGSNEAGARVLTDFLSNLQAMIQSNPEGPMLEGAPVSASSEASVSAPKKKKKKKKDA